MRLNDGTYLYLDQTVKRGVTSQINTASNLTGDANCTIQFEATDAHIILYLTATKDIDVNQELICCSMCTQYSPKDCAFVVDYSCN